MDKRFWWQVVLLSVLTFACVAPRTYDKGLLIVSRTYTLGSERLLNHVSPYNTPAPGTDWFKYSPLVALGYTAFTWFPEKAHALLWVWLNVFVFWLGVSAWIRLDRKTSPWIWFALLAASVELNISLVHHQINGLLTGMIMFGMAAYTKKAYTRAGAWLALATNFKIIPIALLGALGLQMRRKYVFAVIVSLALATLIPALFIGFETNFQFHVDWILLLVNDIHSQGIADIGSLLSNLNAPLLGSLVRWAVLFVTAGLMLTPIVRGEDPDWELWLSLGLLGITLWNPRTESPTFVLVAPTYVLFMRRWLGPGWQCRLGRYFLAVCFFLITFSFSDVWPKSVWDPGNPVCAAKTVGTLLLFLVSATLSFKHLLPFRDFGDTHDRSTRRLVAETS